MAAIPVPLPATKADPSRRPQELDPLRPVADGQRRTGEASRWEGEIHAQSERARGVGAGTAPSAAMSGDLDLRVELAAMAALQHDRPFVNSRCR
jgi:hypothetical protein